MNVSLIFLFVFVWSVVGSLFVGIIDANYVPLKKMRTHKKIILCIVCGPLICIIIGIPAIFEMFTEWLKK